MTSRKRFASSSLFIAATTLVVGSAYAATVDNPGVISFSSNTDSKVELNGRTVWTNLNGSEGLDGALASDGTSSFDQSDIVFAPSTDGNNTTAQLQATSDGTGTYCPNSGAATVTFDGRLRVMKLFGTTVSPACNLPFSGTITLTTGTSGGLTGTSFKTVAPKFVFSGSVGAGGGSCTTTISGTTVNLYFVGGSGTVPATIQLFDATILPTNFSGTGC